MDVTQIASVATNLASAQTSDAVNMLVLKKALNTQAAAAIGLLQALPQLSANPNIGRNVNTTA
ncbi:YjfB family protein [Herbaspirillum sp. SJZ099]|uniref:YjfB family protein n=1 Tax=Herbaspirillum sp. SJZ099 TaxID=2572916 RepID=UPI00119CA251|nr:YjfB family protein [Herbaspirillum sp. SJZ099]TWC71793.1 putative motility protein YjfB-like [Herbaspirillum sp. SJZ099]